jgi:N-acetyl-gamma-glutamyl-phosphate reductase
MYQGAKENPMSTTDKKYRIGILGASGYVGAELVRLLAHHPHAEIDFLTAERKAGEPLGEAFPHLAELDLPDLMHIDEIEWPGIDIDVVFCALPHGTTQEIVRGLFHATGHSFVDEMIIEGRDDLIAAVEKPVRVIDLSADFRLTDVDVYARWYGHEHQAPALQNWAVYGLSECARQEIVGAPLVACPGCYPTAALLPLTPLLQRGLIETEDIIIDAKSGVSGAGRAAREASLYTEVAGGLHAYGIASHRHTPEIEQQLGLAAGGALAVNFTPHLAPMSRGILASIYVRLAAGQTAADLRAALAEAYAGEPFVTVVDEGVLPATHHVRGSNNCRIGVFEDRLAGRAILISVIDNLVKGASGQAVQNMNIMLGLEETAGLAQEALFP